MNKELILINFEEIRRRSIKLWSGLPKEYYDWKPDDSAMSSAEIIQHVLGADHGWNMIISGQDMADYRSPWDGRKFTNMENELEFARPYREEFLNTVTTFSSSALKNQEITHPGNGKKRKLGDYLLRIGYHESVHAGQFLSYLRAMGIVRPDIWD
ncbi:DinB family protein [Zhouia spongiae]|uniref:DinB family protein n=1 Tax=Zhouia spongiae TaxID=2202721 RepID=A0ABY3YMP7_9FLAO|nr:DinB family protein [Zhouia spongiae]UNY99080.1 DinB family protein [Zhouia spongiae]